MKDKLNLAYGKLNSHKNIDWKSPIFFKGVFVMGKVTDYRETLRNLADWDQYLLAESCLPGPRANLELIEAVAAEGDLARFQRYLLYTAEQAPYGSALEFLPVCGVVGLGRLLAEGQIGLLKVLRRQASDPRWRIREGVAIALQKYGRKSMERLLRVMEEWSRGNLLERRAVAAAICEPGLLKKPEIITKVLGLLDQITEDLSQEQNRKNEDFKVLRKSLGYCWSVAVVADPVSGKKLMEKWFAGHNPDIRWIMRENLKKNRLRKLDPAWVEMREQELSSKHKI
jgi:hypothetical protein